MKIKSKKSKLDIPAPRPTKWAYYYAFLYIGVPLLGAALLVDVIAALYYASQGYGCWSWFCWVF